jgi:hypothetical protein
VERKRKSARLNSSYSLSGDMIGLLLKYLNHP